MLDDVISGCGTLVQWLLFLYILLSTIATIKSSEIRSCLPADLTSPTYQPAQPDLPDSFRVKVEVTAEETNNTEQAEEIVDNAGNRAVLHLLKNGDEIKIIFSYDTQEIFYITENNCTVRNMTTDTGKIAFFGETMVDGIGHIPDGPSTLYFGPEIAKIYKGTERVRDIWCDWWQTCISLPGSSDNVTINYYFSQQQWHTPSTFPQVPVRFDINGTQTMADGIQRVFHRVYHFFDFIQDTDSDSTVFETPEGVVCPGRKQTLPMPSLTSQYYHFREEIIDINNGVITQADIWFDLVSKLVRVDYRSPVKTPPLDTTYPVSEIHDFNYGVRYVKDKMSGECHPMALTQNSFDAKFNVAAYILNGSYSVQMKKSLPFLYLDSNFTYSGQRTVRDVLCDVYISHRNDFDFYNNGSLLEAKVEVYYLAEGWTEIPDDALDAFSQRFPFKIHSWLPKPGYNFVYNIFDFDTERPEIFVYDVTDCFNDSSSLRFRVRFQGSYNRNTEHMVRLEGQNVLARSMEVSPLRVNNLLVEYDTNYLYISATLLDRAPSMAQFTHLSGVVLEKTDDESWSGVSSAADCSEMCVNYPDITCLSFEYCPADRDACRLSRHHVSDGTHTVVSETCDLYSRTVDTKTPPELTVSEAYLRLLQDIRHTQLYFYVEQDNQQDITYTAVDSEILFGRLEDAPMPSLTGQFAFRMEMVVPANQTVNTYDVWYDSVSKLVRIDSRDAQAGPPYYSPYPITTIHDFNTGVAYNIDTYRGNCSTTPISTNFFDTQTVNWTQVHATGAEELLQKSSLQFLFMNGKYQFTGQKTVRGILCDVFEMKRTDFSLGSGNEHSIFQYYFQSSSWVYEADTMEDITINQPVQLLILDDEEREFIIINYYNFNDEHVSYRNFDIASCFTGDQRIEFVLDFNQTYHPYLDTNRWLFEHEVQMLLSSGTRISPLRIQNLQVTYNLDHTYVIATLLGQVSPDTHFAETGTASPYNSSVIIPESNVLTCAANCYYNQDMTCNSFDICPDRSCYLSTQRVPYSGVTNTTVTCQHFSRLVNSTVDEPQLEDALITVKDLVFKGLFTIKIPIGNEIISYIARDIRDDILHETADTGGTDLHTKFQLYQTGAEINQYEDSLNDVAVDKCASVCLQENKFTCHSFSYCYTTADCYLSNKRPATSQSLVSKNRFCDLYMRLYLDDYKKYPGRVVESSLDSTKKTNRAEDCASLCSTTETFTCQSFDFCPFSGDCRLHQAHILDNSIRMSNSSACTHYVKSSFAIVGRTSTAYPWTPGRTKKLTFSMPAVTPASSNTIMHNPGCMGNPSVLMTSNDTGPRVGIAVGVLVLGFLLGAGLVLLLQRHLRKGQGDLLVELIQQNSHET